MKITKESAALLLGVGAVCILSILWYVSPETIRNVFSRIHTPQTQSVSTDSGIQLLISIPKEGVSIVNGTTINWAFTDPTITEKYPSDTTFVVLDIIASDNTSIGSVGDGYRLDKSSTQWNVLYYIRDGFYKINSGEQYKIRATLQYQPKEYTCNPAFKGECRPVYSPADQALIDQAKQYRSESVPFIFDFTGYHNQSELVTYQNLEMGIGFKYPSSWGRVTAVSENCWLDGTAAFQQDRAANPDDPCNYIHLVATESAAGARAYVFAGAMSPLYGKYPVPKDAFTPHYLRIASNNDEYKNFCKGASKLDCYTRQSTVGVDITSKFEVLGMGDDKQWVHIVHTQNDTYPGFVLYNSSSFPSEMQKNFDSVLSQLYFLPKRVYISDSPNVTRPEKDWVGITIDYGGISASLVRIDLTGWSVKSTVSGKSFKLEGMLGNGWDALIVHTKAAPPDSPESSRMVGGETHLNLGAETIVWSEHDTIVLKDNMGAVVDTYTY